jgi:DNA-binding ferritin-like protein
MLQALNARMAKLSSYYTKTKEIHGSLYAIRTILAP